MPRTAPGQLTDMQDSYCQLVISGVEGIRAAELAGYKAPGEANYALRNNPKVLAAIAEGAGRQVVMAAGMAVKTLVDLLDVKNPPQTRLGAAKTLLDRAGVVEKGNDPNGKADGKSLLDMSERELLDMQQKLDGLRSSIDNALTPRVIDHQSIDIVDESTTV